MSQDQNHYRVQQSDMSDSIHGAKTKARFRGLGCVELLNGKLRMYRYEGCDLLQRDIDHWIVEEPDWSVRS